MKRFTTALKATTMAFAAAGLMATSAMATDGMFGNGTGARNKALAGAGVANEKDATAISLNPAGLVHSENQLDVAASLFSPRRTYNVGAGEVDSNSQYFVIPNIAYSHRVDGNTVFGLSMYGNGGMNTDYPTNIFGAIPGNSANLGIDLTQIFLSAGVAKQYGNISLGVAPIVGIQIFEAEGVPARDASNNPILGPSSRDVAVGIGVRAGVEWAVSDSFRVGVAGATPTYMQAFTGYDAPGQLFGITHGVLDVPGTVQAGVALDLMPGLTFMADYKRIFYSSVKAIGTPGAQGGFGWDDINIYKFGAEWGVSNGLTLRAGYSYNDSPLATDAGVFLQNILAPATVQHHFTGGAEIAMTDNMNLELAGMYAAKESVSTPAAAPAPAATVSMYQWELTAGIKWKLGN